MKIFHTIIDKTTDKTGKVLYTITTETGLFYVGISGKGTKRPKGDYGRGVNRYRNGTFRKTYRNGEIVGERESWRNVHIILDSCLKNGEKLTLTMENIECDTTEELCKIERETLKEMMIQKGIHNTMNQDYVGSIIKELT